MGEKKSFTLDITVKILRVQIYNNHPDNELNAHDDPMQAGKGPQMIFFAHCSNCVRALKVHFLCARSNRSLYECVSCVCVFTIPCLLFTCLSLMAS